MAAPTPWIRGDDMAMTKQLLRLKERVTALHAQERSISQSAIAKGRARAFEQVIGLIDETAAAVEEPRDA